MRQLAGSPAAVQGAARATAVLGPAPTRLSAAQGYASRVSPRRAPAARAARRWPQHASAADPAASWARSAAGRRRPAQRTRRDASSRAVSVRCSRSAGLRLPRATAGAPEAAARSPGAALAGCGPGVALAHVGLQRRNSSTSARSGRARAPAAPRGRERRCSPSLITVSLVVLVVEPGGPVAAVVQRAAEAQQGHGLRGDRRPDAPQGRDRGGPSPTAGSPGPSSCRAAPPPRRARARRRRPVEDAARSWPTACSRQSTMSSSCTNW